MSKRRPHQIRPRQVAGHTQKSLPAGLTGNLGGGVRDMSRQIAAAMAQQQSLGQQAPMPRDTFPYSFGPGVPLYPAPLDPTRTDSGRAEPRIYEYPVSWNVPGTEHRLVPWTVLRKASNIGVIRDCIRIRKNEITSLDWDIAISQRAVETAQREKPEAARADVERDLREKLTPQIDRLAAFWRMPDRGNGYTFGDWITEALEEHLVLDALAIYPRFTYGGDLYSLEILDGSTIKPLLDNRGGRPLPPYPAYQQQLYGFPRGEFVADVDTADDGGMLIPNGYASDQLIYQRREVRTFSPYGLSAVEQSLTDVDLWMKRMAWLRAEYTDGVMPAGWMKNTGESQWSPQQLLEYEREFNDYYGGLTQARQRFRILPPGIEPDESKQIDERYKPDYDLHLLKIVVAHFDMTIAELGFTEAKGLGSSGYHEGQENVQERKGTRPDLKWLMSVLTDISRTHLAMPEELEFRFLGLDDEDQAAADELNKNRFSTGGLTLNEWRDDIGRPRYNFPEADMPMIVGQRGVVFLEGASELASPGEMVMPGQAPPQTTPPEGQDAEPDGEDEDEDGTEKPPEKPAAGQDDAKTAEKAAHRRWTRKGSRGRAFTWHHHTADEVAELTKAGGVDPKAPVAREWPGWSKDQAAATLWAGRISEALTGALDVQTLAADWRQARKAAPAMPPTADAAAWLGSRGVSLTAVVRGVLRDVYTDGYLIGDRSAIALLTDEIADWGGWTPGDTEAALEILAGDRSLTALLDEAEVHINSIAAHRMDELALELARALENGDSVDTLASALADILDDPRWAYTVATTELNRAMSSATLNRYARNGIEASYWMTAEDERVCPDCGGNEDAGAIPISQPFPNGSYQPPAHPSCRCALAPVVADINEVDTAGLTTADLEES